MDERTTNPGHPATNGQARIGRSPSLAGRALLRTWQMLGRLLIWRGHVGSMADRAVDELCRGRASAGRAAIEFELAGLLLRTGQHTDALEFFVSSMERAPKNSRAWLTIARLQTRAELRSDQIDRVARACLAGAPHCTSVDPLVAAADLLSDHGRIDESIALYQEAACRLAAEKGAHPAREDQATRQAPDFLIVGAMKGGTTSLFRYLTQHPRILPPVKKEVHFFDKRLSHGRDWYDAHFMPRSSDKFITGESSPSYFLGGIAEHVKEHCGAAKYIVLLRDPVQRAISHYNHSLRLGLEHRGFGETIDHELDVLSRGMPFELKPDELPPTYLWYGLYAHHLRHWLKRFPREQLLILRSEDMFDDPRRIVHETCRFLEIDPIELPEYPNANPGAALDDGRDVEAKLVAFFEPRNRELQELRGDHFTWGASSSTSRAHA
jgi:hypothetical protein